MRIEWWVTVSLNLYSRLLSFYPAAHRREYGVWMQQLFGDLCRDAVRQRGGWGLLMLWGRMLPDLLVSAFQEHGGAAKLLGIQDREVTPTPWPEVLLACLPGAIFGFFSIVDHYTPYTLIPAWPFQVGITVLSLFFIWVGYRRQREVRPWAFSLFGVVGVFSVSTVLAIFTGMRPVLAVGYLVFGLCLLAVGAGVWRNRRALRIPWSLGTLLLLMGFFDVGHFGSLFSLPFIAFLLLFLPLASGLAGGLKWGAPAALLSVTLVWFLVGVFLDPGYALETYSRKPMLGAISAVLAVTILIVPVVSVLRARTQLRQIWGLVWGPALGIVLAEGLRMYALMDTERPMMPEEWVASMALGIELIVPLMLIGIFYAQVLNYNSSRAAG